MNRKVKAIVFAFLAAVFYAVNSPLSKLLLRAIAPAFLASFLYLGAGIGIGILYLSGKGRPGTAAERLSRPDLPYVVGMIALDIAAPILLMFGLVSATSANASLLGNFEIVATSLIALLVFREAISPRLWLAILLITLSSALLSLEDLSGLHFSFGSVLVLLAAACWGFENNCTRMISARNTFQIVTLKGIFSGIGSFIVALVQGDRLPPVQWLAAALALGFVAYGLSIFLYVRAQHTLGAAKTSAYYAIAPFAGALLSFLILREPVSGNYPAALLVMAAGSVLVVVDTLLLSHAHRHTHVFVHTHGGSTHSHVVEHAHPHRHYLKEERHGHHHSRDPHDPS